MSKKIIRCVMNCQRNFQDYNSIYDNMTYCNYKRGCFIRPCNPCIGGGWNNWDANCCNPWCNMQPQMPPCFPPCFDEGNMNFRRPKTSRRCDCQPCGKGPFVFFYFPF